MNILKRIISFGQEDHQRETERIASYVQMRRDYTKHMASVRLYQDSHQSLGFWADYKRAEDQAVANWGGPGMLELLFKGRNPFNS